MSTLRLYFLGTLDIRYDDQQLPKPPTLKSQSLLAYLILHRHRPQPRDRLVGLFWGERPERKARRSLSTALWHIRRCLPDAIPILSDPHTAQCDPQSDLWLDVDELESQVSRDDIASLQSAVALYRGDFLDGFYDDWIISERYRLEALFLEALARLMVGHETGEEHQAALATALRLLGRDPLREDAHRLAMRAYCRLGQRNAALEQHHRCREIVVEELGTEPMVETTELYQAILEGRFKVGPLPEILPVEMPAIGPAGRSPLDVIAPVRLVGREQELVLLGNCWQRAQTGYGGLALISGEAGVGKTRLVEEFANRLRWQGVRVLWGRCYEFERLLPYQPIAEAVRTVLRTLTPDELAGFPAWTLGEVARLVPEVSEIQPGLGATPSPEGDQEEARLFAGLARLLAELSSRGAILIVLEDLHWASESTLGLIHYLARHLADHAILTVGTLRPEEVRLEHPLFNLRRRLTREGLARPLRLSRLSPEAVEAMVVEMSGASEAVAPLAERLYQETEGNPFFLMEIVKALFQTEVVRLEGSVWQGDFARISEGELPLPASVSEAIQARAHRLEENAQEALRLAAVLGREFDFDLLHAAWGQGADATLAALDDLLRQRLIGEGTDEADSDYVFTHHKIQEVVYEELPRRQRQYLHGQVGAAIEQLLGAEVGARAGELSFHFEQARQLDGRLTEKAITYLLQAGQQAVRQSANQEAISYYRRGLDILHSLPETSQRAQQEIELQIALTVPTTVVQGYGSPETKRVYDRARELCRKLGETPALFTSLMGLSRYYGVAGDHQTAVELAEQLLAIAQTAQDTALLLEAYRAMGGPLFALGRLKQARALLERGAALYDLAQHESHAYRFGHDPAVTYLGYLGMTLWLLGYPEQAQVQSQNLRDLMQFMAHPSSQAYAHCLLAMHACIRHDAQEARDHAEEAIRLGQLHGLPSWTAMATALRGWALIEQGQVAEGLAQLSEGTTVWRAIGYETFAPFFLALQAEACLKVQKLEEGIAAVSAARAIAQSGGDRYWMAELSRLHGELLRVQGRDGGEAEAHFRQAMETARQQEVRMLELRAAMSLGQLWQRQGKREEARQLLAEIYGWFTEGFDTPDLKEVKALLEELS